MSTLRRLAAYLRPEVASLALAYVCVVVLSLTTAFYAFLAGPALKFVFSGDFGDLLRNSKGELRTLWAAVPAEWISTLEHLDPLKALLFLPALLVATAVLKGLAQAGQFFLFGRLSQRVLLAVRRDAFSAMLRQPPAFFAHRTHGDLLSRLTNDANILEQAFFYGCAPVLREPLSVLALLVFCFSLNAKLALFTFVIVPLAVIPLAKFGRRLKRVSRRGQAAQGDINAATYEALAGVAVVQAFGAEDHEAQRLQRAGLAYYRQMLRSYFIRAVRTPTMEALGAMAIAGLLYVLGYQVQRAGADPAEYLSFFIAVVLMYDPLKRLGNVSDYLATGAAAAERLFEVIDLVPTIADKPDAATLPPFAREIVFEDVEFAYEDAPVLRGLSLSVPKGARVALVGPSGGGKTTVANLLPRFYDVRGGAVTIDGHDVRDVTLTSLRAQISIVSQETFLFNASVRDNIAYARPDADTTAVERAARDAHAHEFITALPQGYDTVIGERGVKLSGGQRQRLAIARALLRNTPILILDEATSNLDVESERHVQQALDQLMQGRTSLVIAHRLSTVRGADRIAVLKGGRVVELGTHAELMRLDGEYARLCALQFDTAEAASASA